MARPARTARPMSPVQEVDVVVSKTTSEESPVLKNERRKLPTSTPRKVDTTEPNRRVCTAPMPSSPVVLIARAEEVPQLKNQSAFQGDILVFADSESLRALETITQSRPPLVVLNRGFATTSRGAMVVNRIKTDPALSHCQIRVLSQATDYVRLLSHRAEAGLAPATAVPGDPLSPDSCGTREGHRVTMRPGVEVRLNGEVVTLIDVSPSGAQVLVSTLLRLNQRVRLRLADDQVALRIAASVEWATFEPSRGNGTAQYRAGLRLIDVDQDPIDKFCTLHGDRRTRRTG